MAIKKTELIEIKNLEMVDVPVKIVGTSPLIMHAWSAKAKRQILEKEFGNLIKKMKEPRNPAEDFASSMYWLTPMPDELTYESVEKALETARFGFPVTAFKKAAISAAYRMGWTENMVSLRGAFFIVPDTNMYYSGNLVISPDHKQIDIIPNTPVRMPMVEIHSDPPIMREDPVVLGGMSRSADLRYRGEFNNWSATLTVRYNRSGRYSLEHILNFINAGGFVNGVGDWRPEKDGENGTFKVDTGN
jgi:hypothetical protein